MKFTQLFGITLREAPQDVELVSHQLLVRAGYIRQLSSGIFSNMHLAIRSLNKIEAVIREEMNAIGGVEISMPVVHPAEIWQATGRYDAIDESLARFKDRTGRPMVLAMTHEEVVAALASTEISSYRQMPKLIYQIQTKFRDELRSRGGLIRVREFRMKDSYSMDSSWEALTVQYQAHFNAYLQMFKRLGLPVVAVISDSGMMGGRVAHEFMYLSPIGEDTLFTCDTCDYIANKEVATIGKIHSNDEPKPLEKVATPGTKTIAELADFLGIAASQTAKVVFYTAEPEDRDTPLLFIALVRGDMEANEIALQKIAGTPNFRPATEEEIRATGAVPGYASPIGISREHVKVVVDQTVARTPNLVTGANSEGYHLLNSCYGRDYEADVVADIAVAFKGAPCPACTEGTLDALRGVEVGNIFQLGTKYTRALDATFMDEQGRPQPIIMGSYGIGIGRLLACLAEEYNDKDGLCWPVAVAPYHVMLVSLSDSPETIAEADRLYKDWTEKGVEVLYDNRTKKAAGPGIKFKDADLLGIPLRITVSKKTLASASVEWKERTDPEKQLIPVSEITARVTQFEAR